MNLELSCRSRLRMEVRGPVRLPLAVTPLGSLVSQPPCLLLPLPLLPPGTKDADWAASCKAQRPCTPPPDPSSCYPFPPPQGQCLMLLRLSGAEGRVSGREIAFRWLLVAVGSPHAAVGVPVCALWVRRREGRVPSLALAAGRGMRGGVEWGLEWGGRVPLLGAPAFLPHIRQKERSCL